MRKINRHEYQPGDGVSICCGHNCMPGTVTRTTPTRVYVKQDRIRTKGTSVLFLLDLGAYERMFTVREGGEVFARGSTLTYLSPGREVGLAENLRRNP